MSNIREIKPLPLELLRELQGPEAVTKALGIANGKDGKDGENGKDGAPGVQGDKGDPGAKGDPGKSGKDGKDGKPGSNGRPGKDGKPGRVGKQGARGKQGPPGKQGKPGKPGKTGKQGRKGDRGLRGLKGAPGKDADMNKLTKAAEKVALKKVNDVNPVVDVNIIQDARSAQLVLTKADGSEEKNDFMLRVSGVNGRYARSKINELSSDSSGGTLSEDTILYLASIAPSTATYTDDKLTTLTYSDFQGITNHTKSLTYTGNELTATQEIFDYDGKTWTVDITLTYSSGVWQSKNINISKV
jgi:hypothetical protein